jgi:hypothetical protein
MLLQPATTHTIPAPPAGPGLSCARGAWGLTTRPREGLSHQGREPVAPTCVAVLQDMADPAASLVTR